MDIIQMQDRSTLTEALQDRGTLTEKIKVRRRKEKPIVDSDQQSSTTAAPMPEKKKPDSKKLKVKLQEVAEENSTLSRAIHEKNQEIVDLKRSVQSLNEVLNSVPIDELRCNSSIASTKILELSKKNRQLRAELETAKNRVNKKDLEVQKLERQMKLFEEKFHHELDAADSKKSLPSEELHAKLNATTQKLFESRNKCVELQAQLKLAQKCLQQEVGENFNLNLLASHAAQSNWRGRAQQIIHLQQRLHDLKERLEIYENTTGTGPLSSYNASLEAPPTAPASEQSYPLTSKSHVLAMASGHSGGAGDFAGHATLSVCGSNTSFDRYSSGVRKTELLHRAKVEGLEKEINSLKAQIDDQRSKVLALKVRNKTLNDELAKYKAKASTLEEQTDFNGMSLATINEKLNLQKYEYENRMDDFKVKLKEMTRQRDEVEYRKDEMDARVHNLEAELKAKKEEIFDQKEIIKKLEIDLKAVCGDFLFACRELRKEEFIAILDALEAEKNLLVEHNKTVNDRLANERSKNENLTDQLSKQKVRISRLEAKIRELEKDLEANAERKKRTQRIAEYVSSVSSNHSIHSSMGTFVFENSAAAKTDRGDNVIPAAEIIEMQNQLEFSNEKITLLEEKIKHLADEKQADAKTFDEILITSKSIILDTILSQKKGLEIGIGIERL